MKAKRYLLLASVVLITLLITQHMDETVSLEGVLAAPPVNFQNQTWIAGLTQPTGITFTPDGRMLIIERLGKVKVVQPGGTQVDATPFHTLPNINVDQGERGLVGIVLDPDFMSNGYYYLFYTANAPLRDRVSRFTASGNGTVAGSEMVIWQDNVNAGLWHHGGSIVFGPDGKLYISTGDHFDQTAGTNHPSQRLSSYHGKILRINKDGTIPTDNPFYDGAGPNFDEIWARGLRNPFRFSFDSLTGSMYIGDVGNSSWEELNKGIAGSNYGWPICEGACNTNGMTNPIYTYSHNNRDASITGGFVYRGLDFPSGYYGSYFFADYAQNWIKRLTMDANGNSTGTVNFEPISGATDGPYGDIVDLKIGPDGALYYVDIALDNSGNQTGPGSIRRISYASNNQPATITNATANPTSGLGPTLNVNFTGAATDPEDDPLTYTWDFGDNTTGTGANVLHAYQAKGQYTARLTVSDPTHLTLSSSISIPVGAPPNVVITAPTSNSAIEEGAVIAFNGIANDSDGVLANNNYSWTVNFHHDTHIHPAAGPITGPSGTYTISSPDHQYGANTWYEFILTVTDANGLRTSKSVGMYPLVGSSVTDCSNDTQLSSALASGGTVTFNCGGIGAPATIVLSTTKTVTTSVIIDGGGKVILSGGNARRLFQVNAGVTLTLQNITLSNGRASSGGGAVLNSGSLIIQNSTLSNNTLTGDFGGAIKSTGSITITNSIFMNNSAPGGYGGAIDTASLDSSVNVTNSTFDNNAASIGGGAIASNGTIIINDSTFKNNSTASSGGISGGGAIETTGSLTVNSSTFNNNTAGKGGAIYNEGGSAKITNSTFSSNAVNVSPRTGGAIHNQNGTGSILVVASTFSGNSATGGSGGTLYNTSGSSLTVRQSILAGGSPSNCSGVITSQGSNLETSIDCNFSASGNLQNTNPQLGVLANNGGPTQTHALLETSPAIDAATICTDSNNAQLFVDQRGATRPLGSQCDIGAYEKNATQVSVSIGGIEMPGSPHSLQFGQSTRQSYGNVNAGPVRIASTTTVPLIAAERVIYKVNSANTSFSEMMGLPNSLLHTAYWLPWYNNVDLDTQLRFGNVSGSTATVRVYIGGVEMTSGCTSTPSLAYPYVLGNGASLRVSCAGINNGPVKIESNVNVVAAERVIYNINGTNTSFSEMMALPDSQLNTTYWFPWYNNIDLDTQLRFGNVSGSTATVRVYIGGTEMTSGCTSNPNMAYPYVLGNGASIRVSCAGINNGPVKIESNVNIVAAERVIYNVNSTNTSFSEMMGLPNSLLNTSYWLPWYNNVDLDTQLRIGNVSGSTATVRVYIGGVEMTSGCTSIPSLVYPYVLGNGASLRVSCAGVNNGPVKIESTGNIVAAERVIYKVNGTNTSFSEMMGLPNSLLDTTYWFPWYNNIDLDTQLRFGVP